MVRGSHAIVQARYRHEVSEPSAMGVASAAAQVILSHLRCPADRSTSSGLLLSDQPFKASRCELLRQILVFIIERRDGDKWLLGVAVPPGVGGVEGFESPWLECFFCPFLVLDVEPNTQSVFVPGVVMFVAGQLPGSGKIVLELGEPGEPVLVEF